MTEETFINIKDGIDPVVFPDVLTVKITYDDHSIHLDVEGSDGVVGVSLEIWGGMLLAHIQKIDSEEPETVVITEDIPELIRKLNTPYTGD